MTIASKYDCPRCDGTGFHDCDHCGANDVECRDCLATGLDPEKIDVHGYNKAWEIALQVWDQTCHCVQNGVRVGEQSLARQDALGPEYADEVIYYADYAKGGTNGEA